MTKYLDGTGLAYLWSKLTEIFAKNEDLPQYVICSLAEYNAMATHDADTYYIIIGGSEGGGGSQVQADWAQNDSSALDFIKNKPTIPTVPTNVSTFTNDAGYLTSHQSLSGYATETWVGQQGYLTQHQDISGKADKVTKVSHGTSDTTFTLTPNVFHVWGEVASLTLTLGTEISGIYNEFMFQFESGATATTLNLPSTVKWVATPTIEANKTYQVSIVDNIALIAGV